MLNKLGFFLFTFTFGLISLVRAQHAPCDTSNRWNKAILFWLVFTRHLMINALFYKHGQDTLTHAQMLKLAFFEEEAFVKIFPWLKYDMWEMLTIKFQDS